MSCCTADPARATLGPADPRKHVNYVLGMVLGVDDLTQEFGYLDNRVRAVVRELVGYGTDRGLAVTSEGTELGPRIRVSTGVAYTPSGQMVCVGSDQCAPLNGWLAGQSAELGWRLGAAAQASLRLAVVLCYRECLTDNVPIPGEPCRSEDALMSPSRIKDEFTLELRFAPPAQTEEDAVRELVRWLRAIPQRDGSLPDSPDSLVSALRAAASPWFDLAAPCASLPESSLPDTSLTVLDLGDPPADLAIPPEACAEYLRAAFRLWVTELRPAWIARFGGCHACGCEKLHDDCVLLAELDVPVLLDGPGRWVVSDVEPVTIDEARRPYLLHARLQQEWLLSMCRCCDGAAPPPPVVLPDLGGDLSGPIEAGVVERIQGVPVVAVGANERQVMTFAGGTWRPANVTPAPPPPALVGDVVGPITANAVTGLQSHPVAAPTAADEGAALVFRNNRWELGGAYVRYPDNETGYFLVAAGRFGFDVTRNRVQVGEFAFVAGVGVPTKSFNDLTPTGVARAFALPFRIDFTFNGYADLLRKGVLVVKATPGFLIPDPRLGRDFPRQSTQAPFQVMFCEYTEEGFAVVIPSGFGLENMSSIVAGEIQIEVSWYPR